VGSDEALYEVAPKEQEVRKTLVVLVVVVVVVGRVREEVEANLIQVARVEEEYSVQAVRVREEYWLQVARVGEEEEHVLEEQVYWLLNQTPMILNQWITMAL
jgi:hypothetical protein